MRRLPSLHLRLSLALLVLGASAALLPPTALADEAMPSVEGETERDAVRTLEALGLEVQVVTVAEGQPGRVTSQEPAAGARVDSGDEAVLRVGVLARILTRVPNAVGMPESRAIDALAEAYELEIRYVEGPPQLQTRVMAQEPAAGRELAFRGHLRLDVVRNLVEVPVVVGLSEEDADEALAAAGLGMHVRRVETAFGREGVVLGQNPRPGARLEVGAQVEVEIRGPRRAPGTRRVLVPHLEGLTMYEAEEELIGLGLVPHVHVIGDHAGAPAFAVLGQEVPAGRRVAPGTHVGMDVYVPSTDGRQRVRLPALHGQTLEEVKELLGHLRVRAVVRTAPSREEPGTILRQSPRAGAFMNVGGTLEITVAAQPGGGWTVPVVAVPSVRGMSAGRARLVLLEAGLQPVLRRGIGANQRVGVVFAQQPDAGARVPHGTAVAYILPLRASVPDIRGQSREQALQTLQRAGLQGVGRQSGPRIASGITQVYAQSEPPGRAVARGSLVEFRYRVVPPQRPMVVVPNVVGMTRELAVAKLREADLDPMVVAGSAGRGDTRVLHQSPRAGSRVPRGTRVTATYRFVGTTLPQFVQVPRVLGQDLATARVRLQQLGFVVSAVQTGPKLRGPGTVIAQNPLGGTNRPRGSTVTLTYRVDAPAGRVVVVPNVVGQRADRALDILRRAGLGVSVQGLGKRVRSQSPAPGTTAEPGTKVKLVLR